MGSPQESYSCKTIKIHKYFNQIYREQEEEAEGKGAVVPPTFSVTKKTKNKLSPGVAIQLLTYLVSTAVVHHLKRSSKQFTDKTSAI